MVTNEYLISSIVIYNILQQFIIISNLKYCNLNNFYTYLSVINVTFNYYTCLIM